MLLSSTDEYRPFFAQLDALYAEMDRKYQQTAEYYGFECHGCDQNCCLTHFYHHTYIEYVYLYQAFEKLETDLQCRIRQRACEVRTQMLMAQEEERGNSLRLMCPLNFGGCCQLYACRPMICRLHGIAYELNVPSRGRMRGSGCHEFEKVAAQKTYKPFDRTPFYNKMVSLEHDFKQRMGLNRKIKKTVAEMLSDEFFLL